MHITDAQLAAYKEQGFLIVENFLTRDEQQAALDGFFTHFAPPYDQYLANDRCNDTPQHRLFPWDHSGLNHVTVHPDLIDAAERVLGTREIRLCEGHLGMKYAGEQYGTNFHIDYGNNTLGPIIEPDDFVNLVCFYCFDDVEEGMAPIRMVPNGRPEEEAVPMIVPGGSVCPLQRLHPATRPPISLRQRDTVRSCGWASPARTALVDGGRTFTYKSGAQGAAMHRFLTEATPRQRELLRLPAAGRRAVDGRIYRGDGDAVSGL